MPAFVRAVLIAVALACCTPALAQAGMPVVTLTDVARMRVQTISFFFMGLLASAWFVKLLWNFLRRDFALLPVLTYGKALAMVVLWGLLFVLVLTMISGARELMTPGAWEKQGLTYRLSQPAAVDPADAKEEQARRRKLERLRAALWSYAQSHDGRFPLGSSSGEVPSELWLASEQPPLRYRYVAGQSAGGEVRPLAYEPGIHGDRRLVLFTDGTMQRMSMEEILKALPPEKP